jgi:formate dehydrogenase subunit gamma
MTTNFDAKGMALHACEHYDNRPDALLEILHDVQAQLGYVPGSVVPYLADALNLSRADVHGVISFYHDFRDEPGGRHRLKICRAEACQSMQGERLARHAEERLGIRFGETSSDGNISLETVYCFGNCALAPSAMLDGNLVGRLGTDGLDSLIDGCREEQA